MVGTGDVTQWCKRASNLHGSGLEPQHHKKKKDTRRQNSEAVDGVV